MATFLSKLFKPKWQSKHLETRKQAVNELDGLNADDLKILIHLAESDPSLDIQTSAIEKISDTDALISLHRQAADTLKSALENRLYEIANTQSLSIFDLIIDQKLLTDMIIKSNQSASFIQGLARIQDPVSLYAIATESRNSQIRQAAAELIDTEKELTELYRHAKGKDKTVYQITKTKLANLRSLAQKKEHEQAQIEKLLNDLSGLTKTEALQHFAARLAHLDKQWQALSDKANDQQQSSYGALNAKCQDKLALLEAEEGQSGQDIPTSNTDEKNDSSSNADTTNEIEETISTIRDTLVRFQAKAATSLEISALDALIKTQENRWIEATRTGDATKAHQISYQDSMIQLRQYLKSMHLIGQHSEQLSLISNAIKQDSLEFNKLEAHQKALTSTLASINWPTQFKHPEILLEANNTFDIIKTKKAALSEQQKLIEEQIEQILKDLDLSLEDKQTKNAAKQLKDIQHKLSSLEPKRASKFQAGVALRKNQLNELKDWQGFVSSPKQEALCVAMERLVETHIDPAEKAEKIKAMQKEWKSLGGTGDQALWTRFKSAADLAYEPCALFFAEQKQLKETNLSKRQTLLAQIQDYVNSIEWESVSSQHAQTTWQVSDWKTAEKINRQAKQEWRDAFPVDFKANKHIQAEFNSIMSRFDSHLEAERQYNIGLKELIVNEAKALVESDDVESSIQTVKSLQEKWQKIGITHHKADRKLWSDYRSACDEVFNKRNQKREEKRSEIDGAIKKANEICQTVEESSTSLSDKSITDLKALLSANRKHTDALPDVPAKVKEKLVQRLEHVSKSIKLAIQAKEQDEKLAQWKEVARKSSILRQAYNTAISNKAASSNQEDLFTTFSSAVPLTTELEKQFDFARKMLSESNLKALNVIDDVSARELCIASEIAAGIESPDEDKALRMQLQVSRLSEGLSSSSENMTREAQLENTLSKWYLSFGLNNDILAILEPRIETARDALLAP